MRCIVCYDIPSDQTRYQLARWLDGFGDRLQYSVFEVELDHELLDEMWAGVLRLVDPSSDQVSLLPLCATCHGRRQTVGRVRGLTKLEEIVWVI